VGGDVATALDQVAAKLMTTCVPRDDAASLIRSTLTSLGVTDPKIEVTGIRQIPIENGDAYVAQSRPAATCTAAPSSTAASAATHGS
jgi:hypothetical protein